MKLCALICLNRSGTAVKAWYFTFLRPLGFFGVAWIVMHAQYWEILPPRMRTFNSNGNNLTSDHFLQENSHRKTDIATHSWAETASTTSKCGEKSSPHSRSTEEVPPFNTTVTLSSVNNINDTVLEEKTNCEPEIFERKSPIFTRSYSFPHMLFLSVTKPVVYIL